MDDPNIITERFFLFAFTFRPSLGQPRVQWIPFSSESGRIVELRAHLQ
jgi:hypothetical protein